MLENNPVLIKKKKVVKCSYTWNLGLHVFQCLW